MLVLRKTRYFDTKRAGPVIVQLLLSFSIANLHVFFCCRPPFYSRTCLSTYFIKREIQYTVHMYSPTCVVLDTTGYIHRSTCIYNQHSFSPVANQSMRCLQSAVKSERLHFKPVDSQIWHLPRPTGLTGRVDRLDRSGLYSPSRIRFFVKSFYVILLVKGYVFPGL